MRTVPSVGWLLLHAAAVLMLAPAPVRANPVGPVVEAGTAEVETVTPETVEIRQGSEKAIINWRSFDIGADETTRFVTPNRSSVTLNRDLSGNPSEILGRLQSNGQLYLINRNGIVFGRHAIVDVAGLLATTHDIDSTDFLNGNLVFSIPGAPDASVVNQGQITVGEAGIGALVAPHVRNAGAIVARLGKVELASGSGFTLDLAGDRVVSFLVENPNEHEILALDGTPVTALVENLGSIIADGGHVVLTAKAARGVVDSVINTDGIVQANTVSLKEGKIVLDGGDTGRVRVSGELAARGDDSDEPGGRIEVTGERILVDGAARVDATGHGGGGRIAIGGLDEGGSTEVVLKDGSVLDASGLSGSPGGRVLVLANDALVFQGDIRARGQGFVETSSRGTMELSGTVDTGGGTYQIDPSDMEIGESNTTGAAVFMHKQDILRNLRNNNVEITTDPDDPGEGNGDITVSSDFVYESAYHLALFAARNIVIEESLYNRGEGDVYLLAGWSGEGDWRVIRDVVDGHLQGFDDLEELRELTMKVLEMKAYPGGIRAPFRINPSPEFPVGSEYGATVIVWGVDGTYSKILGLRRPEPETDKPGYYDHPGRTRAALPGGDLN